MNAFEMIEKQQEGKENTPAWMVGEQLKDILRDQPELESIVAEDLQNPDMSIDKCEGKIRAYANKNKGKSSCFCVIPTVAEGIIREFYGLPPAAPKRKPEEPAPVIFNADDDIDLFSL